MGHWLLVMPRKWYFEGLEFTMRPDNTSRHWRGQGEHQGLHSIPQQLLLPSAEHPQLPELSLEQPPRGSVVQGDQLWGSLLPKSQCLGRTNVQLSDVYKSPER